MAVRSSAEQGSAAPVRAWSNAHLNSTRASDRNWYRVNKISMNPSIHAMAVAGEARIEAGADAAILCAIGFVIAAAGWER